MAPRVLVDATAVPAEAPAAVAAGQAPAGLAMLLDIDFAAREVRIRVDGEAEPVRTLRDG